MTENRDRPTCETCPAFDAGYYDTPMQKEELGICRLRPPTGSVDDESNYPDAYPDDWCMEHPELAPLMRPKGER